MSRSFRHTPIIGMTTAKSQKTFKVREHQAERRAAKVAVERGDEPPSPREYGDEWSSPRDGKQYIAGRHPHLLRK